MQQSLYDGSFAAMRPHLWYTIPSDLRPIEDPLLFKAKQDFLNRFFNLPCELPYWKFFADLEYEQDSIDACKGELFENQK